MTSEQPSNNSQPSVAENTDRYIAERYAANDTLQEELLATARREGLPMIQVAPPLGRLLSMLIGLTDAWRVLEVGTLAGYSAIWMGRALPTNGRLICLELLEKHATIARGFIAQAGLQNRVEVRVGPALESLEALADGEQFDLMFIDANKDDYPAYLDWALRLVRPGGLIVADNALRGGAVLQQESADAGTSAVQTYNDRVARDPRLESVILITKADLEGVSVARIRTDSADQ